MIILYQTSLLFPRREGRTIHTAVIPVPAVRTSRGSAGAGENVLALAVLPWMLYRRAAQHHRKGSVQNVVQIRTSGV